MKIYGFPVSPFVRKVLVTAHEKGLDVEAVPSNPMQPDEAFLACSPYGKIPALDDGGFKLADSSAIVHYLEAKYPSPALMPKDPQALGKAVWFDEVGDTVVMAAGGPMMFNRFVRAKIMGEAPDHVAAEASEKVVTQRLPYLESVLGEDGWLDGAFSIGDISVASVLKSFSYADWTLDRTAWPRIAAWYDRVSARPGWQKAAEVETAMMTAAGIG
ncbi:MAG: glutathione S-transferase family protein [Croceibacterium sp.]